MVDRPCRFSVEGPIVQSIRKLEWKRGQVAPKKDSHGRWQEAAVGLWETPESTWPVKWVGE